ncbi:MAG: hypothetical protein ACRC33_11595, partial [Gemmataceae bacterium]
LHGVPALHKNLSPEVVAVARKLLATHHKTKGFFDDLLGTVLPAINIPLQVAKLTTTIIPGMPNQIKDAVKTYENVYSKVAPLVVKEFIK